MSDPNQPANPSLGFQPNDPYPGSSGPSENAIRETDRRYSQRVAEGLERLGRLSRAREFEGGLNPAQWEALRYIMRSNRFSNAPSALAIWLGSTKGTVSQTVTALERKGLVEKRSRPGPGRGVSLHLTQAGLDLLQSDPLRNVEAAAADMGVASIPLARHLERLIEGIRRGTGSPSFGTCKDCKWLERNPVEGHAPLYCQRFDSPLLEDDLNKRCIEHDPLDQ
jgi:DNA-binding MarR family transcriptional regulator